MLDVHIICNLVLNSRFSLSFFSIAFFQRVGLVGIEDQNDLVESCCQICESWLGLLLCRVSLSSLSSFEQEPFRQQQQFFSSIVITCSFCLTCACQLLKILN